MSRRHFDRVRPVGFKYIAKNTKQTTKQMRSYNSIFLNLISVIGFLPKITSVCVTRAIHQGAAMWVFHLLIDKTASAVISTYLSAERTDKKYIRPTSGKLRYFTANTQVVHVLLKKYATNDFIVKTDTDITRIAE